MVNQKSLPALSATRPKFGTRSSAAPFLAITQYVSIQPLKHVAIRVSREMPEVKVPPQTIGLAAEFAVASELCRRGVYTQLTLGNQKRTDLLVFSDNGPVVRIEVKGKQSSVWPSCKGVFAQSSFLVFVDYQHRPDTAPPDFYILTVAEWKACVRRRFREVRKRNPDKRMEIDKENCPIFPDEITKSGKPKRGITVSLGLVVRHRDQWEKILNVLNDA